MVRATRVERRRSWGIASFSLVLLFLVGCAPPEPPGPRALSASELELLSVDGRVSKWLPSRFSATITNGNDDLEITGVRFLIHGHEIERIASIAPGESERVSVQYLFPEDPDFGSIDPQSVVWSLVGATGIVAAPDS